MFDFSKVKAIINKLHTGEGKTYSMCKYVTEKEETNLIIVPNISNVLDVLKTFFEIKKEKIDMKESTRISNFLYENKIHIPDSICGKLKIPNPFDDREEELLKILNEEESIVFIKKRFCSYPVKKSKIVIISQYNLGFLLQSKNSKNKNVLEYIDYINITDNIFIDEIDSNLGVISSFFVMNTGLLIKRKPNEQDYKQFNIKEYEEIVTKKEFDEKIEQDKQRFFAIEDKLYKFNDNIWIEDNNFQKRIYKLDSNFGESLLEINVFVSLYEMYKGLVIRNIIDYSAVSYYKWNNIISINIIKKVIDEENCNFFYDFENTKEIEQDNIKEELIKGGYYNIKFRGYDTLVENQHKIIGLSATIEGEYDSEISEYFDKNSIKQKIKYYYINTDLNKNYKIESLNDFLENFKNESVLFITPTLTKKKEYEKMFGNYLNKNQKIQYLTNSELIGSNDLKDVEMFYFLGFKKDELITPYLPQNKICGKYSEQEISDNLYKQTTIRSFNRHESLYNLKKPIFKKYIIQTLGRMNRGEIKEKFIFYNNILSKIINLHKERFNFVDN